MVKVLDQGLIGLAARLLLAGGIGVALGAASPSPKKLSVQLSDASPLGLPTAMDSRITAPQATLQSTMFQPAPMPDPDAARPPGSVAPDSASLMPSLLSEKGEFEGEGYSYSSSQQGALHHRTQPAAGLNLSVPMGQQVGHAPSD